MGKIEIITPLWQILLCCPSFGKGGERDFKNKYFLMICKISSVPSFPKRGIEDRHLIKIAIKKSPTEMSEEL